jgi:DNA-binding PadR family transcriptional regulator
MAAKRRQLSPLALLALAFLAERPMHAYRMFQLMQQREKGSVVNLGSRNSLYQALNGLVRAALAEVLSTEQAENRPERTVYRITAAGTAMLRARTLELLTSEPPEFPSTPVALSLMTVLSPDEVQAALAARRDALAASRDALDRSLTAAGAMQLPRLFVLDDEYRRSALDAQIGWLDALLADLRDGSITWSEQWIAEIAQRFEPRP